MTELYLVIINYHSSQLIAQLLQSGKPDLEETCHIVIVNNSPEDTPLNFPNITLLNAPENLGFGRGCNLGLNWVYNQNPGAIVWLLNPDTLLTPNALQQIRAFFCQHPNISILGTRINTPDGNLWFGGGVFIPSTGEIGNLDLYSTDTEYVTCDWVSGCSLLLNLARFPNCPQFDPAYFLYYEDFDFCRRYAALGHTVAVATRITILHHPSSISDRNPYQKIFHSTYSYLLTLNRYSSTPIFWLRLLRTLTYSVILRFTKPEVGRGKWAGIVRYFQTHREPRIENRE